MSPSNRNPPINVPVRGTKKLNRSTDVPPTLLLRAGGTFDAAYHRYGASGIAASPYASPTGTSNSRVRVRSVGSKISAPANAIAPKNVIVANTSVEMENSATRNQREEPREPSAG